MSLCTNILYVSKVYCFIYRIYKYLSFTPDYNKSRNAIQDTTCPSPLKFITYGFIKPSLVHMRNTLNQLRNTQKYVTIFDEILNENQCKNLDSQIATNLCDGNDFFGLITHNKNII